MTRLMFSIRPHKQLTNALITVSIGLSFAGCVPLDGPNYPGPRSPSAIETFPQKPYATHPDLCWDGVFSPDSVEPPSQEQPPKINDHPPRHEQWFQVPCRDQMSPEFMSSVQRAFKVRGLYEGEITGQINAETRLAIHAFQSKRGLASDILSVDAMRKLGLWRY
ncbi:MAG: peptidoglycan-binding domain-containing protein [Halocynthiibacter sp.]